LIGLHGGVVDDAAVFGQARIKHSPRSASGAASIFVHVAVRAVLLTWDLFPFHARGQPINQNARGRYCCPRVDIRTFLGGRLIWMSNRFVRVESQTPNHVCPDGLEVNPMIRCIFFFGPNERALHLLIIYFTY
jgi:hypothetical protein